MSKYIIVGNWKMNPSGVDEARRIIANMKRLSSTVDRSSVVVAPPLPFISFAISKIGNKARNYAVSVQDISSDEGGSRTGEVGAKMVRSLGVSYAIIGHSERRIYKGESDNMVAIKVRRSLDAGLNTIVCVGETLRAEDGLHIDSLKEQIIQSLKQVTMKDLNNLIIAYEPVWAIGANEAMSTPLVDEMRLFIKKTLSDIFGQKESEKIYILYGGSVNVRNAREIIREGRVQGLLVGRESLNPASFSDMVRSLE